MTIKFHVLNFRSMLIRIKLISCLLLCGCRGDVEMQWTNCRVLDGKGLYHLYWTVKDDHITFKVEVAAKGYVGFGFSANGAMRGSDIVMGWIRDGKPYFQDRHGTGNVMPEIDNSQDWELLEGNENDTHTILVFRRKLMTCDPDDLEIDESTMRVIYAFSSVDPFSKYQVTYHGSHNRGTRSILLLKTKKDISVEGLPYWDVRSSKCTIPSDTNTMYWCTILKCLQLTQKHHIVKINPMIQPGNEGIVHHMILYECVGSSAKEYEHHNLLGYQCFDPKSPDVVHRCNALITGWAVGGEAVVFPDHAAIPLEAGQSKYYMLQVHYNNQAYQAGITDQSGFRMYYTSKLRKHDVGFFAIGAEVNKNMIIPPGQERFTVTGHSNPQCLGPAMPEGGIKLFGFFLHSHLLGRQIKVRHFRKNKELPPIAEDHNYDFNYQDYRSLPKEVIILPQDQLTVECTYNSKDRINTTFGGYSTKDEMCLAFLFYYPKIKRYSGISFPTKTLIMELTGVLRQEHSMITSPEALANRDYIEYLTTFNWSRNALRMIENATRYLPHNTVCVNENGTKELMPFSTSYPSNLEVYQKPSKCAAPEIHSKTFFETNNAFISKSTALMALLGSLWSIINPRLLC